MHFHTWKHVCCKLKFANSRTFQGLLLKDQDNDKDFARKDKDKDKVKDYTLVFKESLRTRTNITAD